MEAGVNRLAHQRLDKLAGGIEDVKADIATLRCVEADLSRAGNRVRNVRRKREACRDACNRSFHAQGCVNTVEDLEAFCNARRNDLDAGGVVVDSEAYAVSSEHVL